MRNTSRTLIWSAWCSIWAPTKYQPVEKSRSTFARLFSTVRYGHPMARTNQTEQSKSWKGWSQVTTMGLFHTLQTPALDSLRWRTTKSCLHVMKIRLRDCGRYCWHLREQSRIQISNLKLTKCLKWEILKKLGNKGRHLDGDDIFMIYIYL